MNEPNSTVDGADWAQSDPGVADRHGGEWVVAVARKRGGAWRGEVVAAGSDPEAVRREGAERLGLEPSEVVVCGVASMDSRVWFGW